jgi:hypothetical protein
VGRRDLRQRVAGLALAESESSKRSKRRRLHSRIGRQHRPAVLRAIRVAEAETARRAPLHREIAAMSRPMVRAAQRHQVVELVPAAFFARPNVVHIDENTMATSVIVSLRALAIFDDLDTTRNFELLDAELLRFHCTGRLSSVPRGIHAHRRS